MSFSVAGECVSFWDMPSAWDSVEPGPNSEDFLHSTSEK